MHETWIKTLAPWLEVLEAGTLAVLLLLLVSVPVIYVQRRMVLRVLAGDASHWIGVLSRELSEQGAGTATSLADGGRSLPERLACFALSHAHLCPDSMERLLEAREIEDRRELERGLGFLGTVGSNAPFVGLAGTVLGILGAFQAMSTSGGVAGPELMGSISGALVATAAGLFVAIPAVVFHNLLRTRVDWILEESRQLRAILVARSLQAVAIEGSC